MSSRDDLRGIFGRPKVFLPVIHVVSVDQTLRSVEVAVEGACDGVFLISHEGDSAMVVSATRAVNREYPELWTGANFLGESWSGAFALAANTVDCRGELAWRSLVDGVWCDDACIDEHGEDQEVAKAISSQRQAAEYKGLYFGGVAFKHQRPVVDFEGAARIAAGYMDVVTTSGEATGVPASLDKIAAMAQGCGETALGIASGIDPDNVGEFCEYVDVFLVATGISADFYTFDPVALGEVSAAIHQ